MPAVWTHFELKYCERCGSLWLRPCGADVIYCPACTRKIAELPARDPQPSSTVIPSEPQQPTPVIPSEDAVRVEGPPECRQPDCSPEAFQSENSACFANDERPTTDDRFANTQWPNANSGDTERSEVEAVTA
ncbi:MAG: hypothetical protein ACR2IF_00660 [Terriglobales bacterium]